MPSQRAERRIRECLSHLIPVPLYDVPERDRICTLCYEAFPPLEEGGDYPVRVRSTHANSTCRHVFGRMCIEEHLSSGRGYSTRCPMCRETWFGDVEADEEPEESAVARAHRQRSRFRAPGATPEDRRMELIFGLENTTEHERQQFFASVGQTLRSMPSAEANAQAAIDQTVQAIADAEVSLRVIRDIQADRASSPAVDISQGMRRGSAEEEDEEMARRLMQAELRQARPTADDATLYRTAATVAARMALSRERDERSSQRMSQQGRGTAPTLRHSGASPRRDDGATLPSAGRMMRTMGFLEQLHRTEEVMTDSSDIAERMDDVERAVDALWRRVDDDRRRRGNIQFVRRNS